MTIGGVDCVFVSASKRPSLATCHTMRRSSNSDLILRRPPSWAAVSKDGHRLGTCHTLSLSVVFASERSMPPLCKFGQAVPFSLNRRFLLGTRPSLNLTCSRNRIGNGFNMLPVTYPALAPPRHPASMQAHLFLRHPSF